MRFFSLEFYIDSFSAIGFFMFFPAILFFVFGIIFLIAKKKKIGKNLLIISGTCFLISVGLCGIGAIS